MRVFVPFDAVKPKTRLSELFDERERQQLAEAMLSDVLATLQRAGHSPTVLATGAVDCDAPVVVDDRPLTPAVNDVLARSGPVAVVMADLALLTEDAMEQLLEPGAEVVLAPGLGGGTNALVARHSDFRVDYHGTSFRDHREAAGAVGATVATVDSFRLAVDVDAPSDLVDVLVHTNRETARTLRKLDVSLTTGDGLVTISRQTG